MSTRYYLSNRKKREEIQKFNKFWEEEFIPGIKEQINHYCKEVNGLYVNTDFAEEIIDEKISRISCEPGDSASYETEIGSSRWNGKRTLFQWEGVCVNETVIIDETSLVGFFSHKENQEQYCIVDEYDKEYTLNEFLDRIKYSE